jgi:hypothetical protein
MSEKQINKRNIEKGEQKHERGTSKEENKKETNSAK